MGKGLKINKSIFYFLNGLWAVFPGINQLSPANLLFTSTAQGPAKPAQPSSPLFHSTRAAHHHGATFL
jgi:hypothetical protein